MQPFPNDKWSVQSLSRVQLFVTAARQASLCITNSQSLLKLMSIESVMPFNYLTLFRPLLLLPSIFPSIGVFSNESVLRIRWPKYWSFSFSISPSNEYSGLISFRMDWLDLLAVQGTLKSLLQHHSSKTSIPWRLGLTNDIMYIFICLLFLYILWCYVCVLIFSLFFKMGCFKCSWCILDTNSLSHMYCATFSPTLAYLYILLSMIFTEILNLKKVQTINIFIHRLFLVLYLKTLLPGSHRFLLFSYKISIVLHFIFVYNKFRNIPRLFCVLEDFEKDWC